MKVVDIIGYEDCYTICEDGTVTSKERLRLNDKSGKLLKSKVLSQSNRNDYRAVTLHKNGVINRFLVHRLIAIHFIPNPQNYPFINHINGIKHDNRIDNLEWCTEEMNRLHAINVLGVKSIQDYARANKTQLQKPHKGKKLAKTDKQGNIIAKYKSLIEAAKENNINPCVLSYLFSKRRAGRKTRNTDKVGGYYWKML